MRGKGRVIKRFEREWNPKRVGVAAAENNPLLNTVLWIYKTGRRLEIYVQSNHNGQVLGTTSHTVNLPRKAKS